LEKVVSPRLEGNQPAQAPLTTEFPPSLEEKSAISAGRGAAGGKWLPPVQACPINAGTGNLQADLSAVFTQQPAVCQSQLSKNAHDFSIGVDAFEPGQREITAENRKKNIQEDWYRTDEQLAQIKDQIQMLTGRLNSCAPDDDPDQRYMMAQAKADLTFLVTINARHGAKVKARAEWEANHGFFDKLVTSYDKEVAHYTEKEKHRDWEVTPNFLLDMMDQIVKATPEVSGKLWLIFAGSLGTAKAPLFPPEAKVIPTGEEIAALQKMHDALRSVVQRTPPGSLKNLLENELPKLGERIDSISAKFRSGALSADEFMGAVEEMKRILTEASKLERPAAVPQPEETSPAPPADSAAPPPSSAPIAPAAQSNPLATDGEIGALLREWAKHAALDLRPTPAELINDLNSIKIKPSTSARGAELNRLQTTAVKALHTAATEVLSDGSHISDVTKMAVQKALGTYATALKADEDISLLSPEYDQQLRHEVSYEHLVYLAGELRIH
jgi:hypothetical protein